MRYDYYVYLWESLIDGRKHVGKGPGRRAWVHAERAQRGKRCRSELAKEMKRLGVENFKLTFLELGLSEAEALRKEGEHQVRLNTLYPNGFNLIVPGAVSHKTRDRRNRTREGWTLLHKEAATVIRLVRDGKTNSEIAMEIGVDRAGLVGKFLKELSVAHTMEKHRLTVEDVRERVLNGGLPGLIRLRDLVSFCEVPELDVSTSDESVPSAGKADPFSSSP